MTEEKNKEKTEMNRVGNRHLSFIPIPALIAILAVLYLTIKPSLFFEPAWLLPVTNTVFVTLVCFIVAYIAMRNYKATGRIQVLLLGSGVLAFGIGGVVAGLVRSVPGAGANLNVTIYNTGAFLGALLHFIAALLLLAGISPEAGLKRKEIWLAFGYVGLIVFMALLTAVSLKGLIPPFFIQGVGPTVLRQWVLGSAGILFAFSFLIFMRSYLRNREGFLYWYASALALTAISLTAFFIQSAVGSPIGWAGRFAQYLGGIYFLIAVIAAIRSAQARRISFDHIFTTFLSPAEEKFRALSEHSPDVIDRFDREIKHIYVNPAGLRLYGKPAGSLMGKTIEETGLPKAYCSLLKERIQKVFETGQPMEVEDYLPTEKGKRYYQSHCVPEYRIDGTVCNVLVVSRDLTLRKQVEEALRQSEERFRTFSEATFEGIVLSEEGRILDCNEQFARMTGYGRPELVDKPIGSLILPEDCQRVLNSIIAGLESVTEHRMARKDGTIAVVESHGRTIQQEGRGRRFTAIRDITERKKAEQALRESEERYRSLFNGMTEGFALHEIICDEKGDPCDYRFLEINPAFERLTGLKREDVVGKTLSRVLPKEDPKWVKIYGEVALTGKSAHFDNYSSVLNRHYEVFAYCPAPRRFGVLFMDVTERRQAEVALRQRTLELQQLTETLERRVQERTEELEAVNEELRKEIDERERVEIELKKSESHLRQLSTALLSAQERERKLIAQEIHDSMGASLAATKFKVEAALQEMGDNNPQTRADLEKVIPIIQGTIEEARRIQMSLRPSVLDDLGILATINWFCRQYESVYPSIRVTKEIEIQEDEVPDSLKIVIYRVLQEALNNVAKHSKASVVLLFLRKTGHAMELAIQDRGQGVNLEEAYSRKGAPRGLGLDSMRERTELSGGVFSIESSKGAGTVIRATWPLKS